MIVTDTSQMQPMVMPTDDAQRNVIKAAEKGLHVNVS